MYFQQAACRATPLPLVGTPDGVIVALASAIFTLVWACMMRCQLLLRACGAVLPLWSALTTRCTAFGHACPLLQTICNEAKARSAVPLLSKAPAAKKSLERFVFTMKAFLYEQGQQDLFFLGQLKHRDLEGNCVGSQVLGH